MAFSTCAIAQAEFPDDNLAEQIAVVSDGTLRIFPLSPRETQYRHHNRIRVRSSSLRDGWVEIRQCHEHLDPVGALEIVFRPERTRRLTIEKHEEIGTANIVGRSVQLEDIGPGASRCVALESLAVHRLADGAWRLENGPYMRRFLDGYYPMLVILDVDYPADAVHVSRIDPILDDDTVLLVREYAAAMDRYELGLPKGRIIDGEGPLEAANREIREEIGSAAAQLQLLKPLSLAPAYIDHLTHLVMARGLFLSPLPGDEPEPPDIVPWRLSRLEQLLERADFSEARSIAALFLIRHRLRPCHGDPTPGPQSSGPS